MLNHTIAVTAVSTEHLQSSDSHFQIWHAGWTQSTECSICGFFPGSPTMVIHIDTQLDTVFGLYDDKAKAEGITTEEADLRSTTQLGPSEGSRCW